MANFSTYLRAKDHNKTLGKMMYSHVRNVIRGARGGDKPNAIMKHLRSNPEIQETKTFFFPSLY